METLRLIFSIVSAVVGAGFASGREIVQFFSRYGQTLSWPLTALAAASAAWLAERLMRPTAAVFFRRGKGKAAAAAAALTLCMDLFLAGSMTAAAGELAALTVPIHHARSIGMTLTLGGCLLLSRASVRVLRHMGAILVPMILLAWLLCLRLPVGEATENIPIQAETPLIAVAQSIAYAAMNVMLAVGVLGEIGIACTKRQRAAIAVGTGGVLLLLLGVGNQALLRHLDQVANQALPTVFLLRAYGRAGYDLSAAVLYLAVCSTLIAVLQAACWLMKRLCGRGVGGAVFLLTMLFATLGFERIVAVAYPVLGAFSLIMILAASKKNPARLGWKKGGERR